MNHATDSSTSVGRNPMFASTSYQPFLEPGTLGSIDNPLASTWDFPPSKAGLPEMDIAMEKESDLNEIFNFDDYDEDTVSRDRAAVPALECC
jgi:hypothetical protein